MRRLAAVAVCLVIWSPAAASAGDDVPSCRGRLATVVIALGQQPTPGDDVVVGTARADTIHGLGGRDLICGVDGADRLYGDVGNDSMFGGSGVDHMYGGRGEDDLHGGPHEDWLTGGRSSNDRCIGNGGVTWAHHFSCEYIDGDDAIGTFP